MSIENEMNLPKPKNLEKKKPLKGPTVPSKIEQPLADDDIRENIVLQYKRAMPDFIFGPNPDASQRNQI
jgi:hypothetical protein